MAIAYRASSWDGSTAAYHTSISVARQAATAENDIVIASLYLEDVDDTITATGWTQIQSSTNGTAFRLISYWRRAGTSGADPGPWSISWTSNVWSHVNQVSYSGCLASGDVLDGTPSSSTGTPDGGSHTFVTAAMTTGSNNSLVVSHTGYYEGTNPTAAPEGMTSRGGNDGGGIADVVQASAGSTGTKTWTFASGSIAVAAQVFALKEASSGLTATPGAGTVQAVGQSPALAALIAAGLGTLQLVALAPTATVAAASQYAYPTSDVLSEAWTNELGQTSNPPTVNLYASVDEAGAENDSDYVRSPAAPTGHTLQLGLGPLSTPDTGTVTLRVRARWVA